MSWLTTDQPTGVQVIPLGDDLEHEPHDGCACQPKVTLVDGPGHVICRDIPSSSGPVHKHELVQYVRKLVVHSAWDGRPE